jgi:hypothetical protein
VSARTVRAIQRNPVSERKKKKKELNVEIIVRHGKKS